MLGIGRARLKVQAQIPLPGLIILGVDQQGANAGNIGGLDSSKEGIFEESPAKPSPLLVAVDCKAGKQHDGNGVIGEALPDAVGCVGASDGADTQAVIPHNLFGAPTNDIGFRAACLLVYQREPFQKLVKWLFATVKFVEKMSRRKIFNRSERLVGFCHSSTLFSRNKSAKRGLIATGRSRTD